MEDIESLAAKLLMGGELENVRITRHGALIFRCDICPTNPSRPSDIKSVSHSLSGVPKPYKI